MEKTTPTLKKVLLVCTRNAKLLRLVGATFDSKVFSLRRIRQTNLIVGSTLAYQAKNPGFEPQARHQNKIRKIFLLRFSPSTFLAKTLRVNKIAMKSLSKNLQFGVDFKLQVPPLIYKINKNNISGVRNQVKNPA